jgi:hypothetical protein
MQVVKICKQRRVRSLGSRAQLASLYLLNSYLLADILTSDLLYAGGEDL